MTRRWRPTTAHGYMMLGVILLRPTTAIMDGQVRDFYNIHPATQSQTPEIFTTTSFAVLVMLYLRKSGARCARTGGLSIIIWTGCTVG